MLQLIRLKHTPQKIPSLQLIHAAAYTRDFTVGESGVIRNKISKWSKIIMIDTSIIDEACPMVSWDLDNYISSLNFMRNALIFV